MIPTEDLTDMTLVSDDTKRRLHKRRLHKSVKTIRSYLALKRYHPIKIYPSIENYLCRPKVTTISLGTLASKQLHASQSVWCKRRTLWDPSWQPHPSFDEELLELSPSDPLLFPEDFTPRDCHCFWQRASKKLYTIKRYLATIFFLVIIVKEVKILKEVISCYFSPVAMFKFNHLTFPIRKLFTHPRSITNSIRDSIFDRLILHIFQPHIISDNTLPLKCWLGFCKASFTTEIDSIQ